jgi:hypothetical protein
MTDEPDRESRPPMTGLPTKTFTLPIVATAIPLSVCTDNVTPEELAQTTAEVSAEEYNPLTVAELKGITNGTKKIAWSWPQSTFDFSVQPVAARNGSSVYCRRQLQWPSYAVQGRGRSSANDPVRQSAGSELRRAAA